MLILPMLAENGNVTAIKVTSRPKNGNLILPLKTTTGDVCVKVKSIKAENNIGFASLAADGIDVALTAKVAPWATSIIIVMIDESNSVYYPSGYSNWDTDVQRWRNLIDEYGPPRYAMLCNIPPTGGFSEYNIRPEGRSMPGGIVYGRNIPRSPSLQKFIDLYEYCISGGDLNLDPEEEKPSDPKEIVLLVDNSGSMTRSTVEPGITQFEQWLADPSQHISEQYPEGRSINYRYASFSHERWVSMLVDWMINTYLPNLEELE